MVLITWLVVLQYVLKNIQYKYFSVQNLIYDGKSQKSSFGFFSHRFFASMSCHRLIRSTSDGINSFVVQRKKKGNFVYSPTLNTV